MLIRKKADNTLLLPTVTFGGLGVPRVYFKRDYVFIINIIIIIIINHRYHQHHRRHHHHLIIIIMIIIIESISISRRHILFRSSFYRKACFPQSPQKELGFELSGSVFLCTIMHIHFKGISRFCPLQRNPL